MEIRVTTHAFKRLKERYGLNKNAAKRMAKKAYNDGIRHGETSGRLNKFISSKTNTYKRKGSQMRIYGEYLWVFIDNNNGTSDLITAFEIPLDLKNSARSSMAKKKRKRI